MDERKTSKWLKSFNYLKISATISEQNNKAQNTLILVYPVMEKEDLGSKVTILEIVTDNILKVKHAGLC